MGEVQIQKIRRLTVQKCFLGRYSHPIAETKTDISHLYGLLWSSQQPSEIAVTVSESPLEYLLTDMVIVVFLLSDYICLKSKALEID